MIKKMKRLILTISRMTSIALIWGGVATILLLGLACSPSGESTLKKGFLNPPDDYWPGVYWYFMDGNLSREKMTADLEAMKEAGIRWALFLEVNVGVPRGKVDFLSEEWQELFTHAVREAERLGIRLILGSGPGWAGSGGPWVKPEQSMQHLVASETRVKGPGRMTVKLPLPEPKKPFFGEESLTPELKKLRDEWYRDVAVLAFPTPEEDSRISLIEEKALYYRAPFTSQPGVWPYLPPPADNGGDKEATGGAKRLARAVISPERIVDLTDRLEPDGSLVWEVPPGHWTLMRFVARNNGAVTRPAPVPGLGFECDKFSREAFKAHFEAYAGRLIDRARPQKSPTGGGWVMIHIDSWEMGAQNWTPGFREEFRHRRGYDPLPFYPVYAGRIVRSLEESERFLWDLRRTSSELIVENHAEFFKELGRKYGFTLSIEPYDMNPASDFDLGAVADVPMGEFWSDGFGFNSAFSVIEATSTGHVLGRPVIAAESFTAMPQEAWKKYPGNMKDQTDWAFCQGLNRLIFHTFVHNPLDERLKPGMTMGPFGVHWDRSQTWWSMVRPYHEYIARCQFVLSQGKPVADILYLTPEGAPQVFRPAAGATDGTEFLPDKRGYAFDGCSPAALMKLAVVKDGKIVFPGGASYRVLVLPALETMTPELLARIEELVREGAMVVGSPPRRSPSLENYPDCDRRVKEVAGKVWGSLDWPGETVTRAYGKGKIFWGGSLSPAPVKSDSNPLEARLYPDYEDTVAVLGEMGVEPDFACATGKIRYTHRSLPEEGREIYFISNRTDELVEDTCLFRDGSLRAERWDPVTGEIRAMGGVGQVPAGFELKVRLEPHQSFFIIFEKGQRPFRAPEESENFPRPETLMEITGPWKVRFDPEWGGPGEVTFEKLIDWSRHPAEGIRYFSGTALYSLNFDLPDGLKISRKDRLYLDPGEVHCLARIKLNGKEQGIVWTPPFRVAIRKGLKEKGNRLEIEVANLWVNRLIGDENEPWDGVVDGQWPEWLLKGEPRPTRRYTFAPRRFYKQGDPLLPSGLLGPVLVRKQ